MNAYGRRVIAFRFILDMCACMRCGSTKSSSFSIQIQYSIGRSDQEDGFSAVKQIEVDASDIQ